MGGTDTIRGHSQAHEAVDAFGEAAIVAVRQEVELGQGMGFAQVRVMWADTAQAVKPVDDLPRCRCGHLVLVHRERLDEGMFDDRFFRGNGDQILGKCLNKNCACFVPEAV